MRPEVERCGEEAALCSAGQNRVKEKEEEDVVVAGRGVRGEVSRARWEDTLSRNYGQRIFTGTIELLA